MDLAPYVARLHRDLAAAAEAGGEDAVALAERLAAPLDATVRLVLLEALSDAAEEITRDLAPGSVEVRLRRGEPDFVVAPPDTGPFASEPVGSAAEASAPSPPGADDGGTARVSLRLPEGLKARAEEAAAARGISVNAWLVQAVSGALDPRSAAASAVRAAWNSGQNLRGWAR
ncbi:toxin-antitoxin system HicB family antitoxin [Nocardiopsis coralliicola]